MRYNTLKELNRKIKDYEIDNLKKYNYPDLINHLIDYKEHLEKQDKKEVEE